MAITTHPPPPQPPSTATEQLTPDVSPSKGPRRSGQVSRVFALVVALVASGIVSYGLAEGVGSSRVPRKPVGASLADTRLEVSGFSDGAPLVARVLGLVDGQGQPVSRFGTVDELAVPEDGSFVVMLTRNSGELVGLALVQPGPGGAPLREVRISPTTTAEALLALAPGVLHRDAAELGARLGVLTASPNFEPLVQAVRGASDLRAPNDIIDEAIVAIIDQNAPIGRATDQGCDSVNNEDATPRIGACFVPSSAAGQVLIMNEQARWILLFSPNAAPKVCAVVPPAPGNRVVSSSGACGATVDLAAPGPIDSGDEPADRAKARTEVAAALTAFTEYAVPFADLALGASGATVDLDERVGQNPGLVGSQLGALLEAEPALRAHAGKLVDPTAEPSERVRSMLELSRAELDQSALTTALIAESASYAPRSEGLALLDFYDRIVDRLTTSGSIPLWQADGFEQVDLAQLAAGGS